MPQLPNVNDDQLVKALVQIVAEGWNLPRRPSSEAEVKPLLHLARNNANEQYPAVAQRLMILIDQSLKENVEPGDCGDPLLTDDSSLGLRILMGTAPDYRAAPANDRRIQAFSLLFPYQTIPSADSIYRTWQKPMLRLVLRCLRVSFGQEGHVASRQHQSVRRSALAIVSEDSHLDHVISSHVSRSMVDGLREVQMRFHHPPDGSQVTFHPLSGVGDPEVQEYVPGHYRVVFPLLMRPRTGETFDWTFQRQYQYMRGSRAPSGDWISVAGNTAGYRASVAVNFLGIHPLAVCRFSTRELDWPDYLSLVSPRQDEILRPNPDGSFRYEENNTFPEFVYGLAWRWHVRGNYGYDAEQDEED